MIDPGTALANALGWFRSNDDRWWLMPLSADAPQPYAIASPPGCAPPDATAMAGPCPITVRGSDGRSRRLTLFPVDGRRDLFLALDADAALRAFSPTVENLLNQVAHDIRNYAFTVGLQAEMGLRKAAPDCRGNFEASLRQVDALKRYLEHLLLFGRTLKLAPVELDPAAFLRNEVVRYRATRADDAPLTVDVAPDAGVPRVRWDGRALGHAIQAVLDNAVASAVPPPPIRITLTAVDGFIVIACSDEGPGIPAEKLPLLGVPMAVRRAGCAGLGIAIARKMVEAHGGTLEIASPCPGTTVTMRLPLEVSPV